MWQQRLLEEAHDCNPHLRPRAQQVVPMTGEGEESSMVPFQPDPPDHFREYRHGGLGTDWNPAKLPKRAQILARPGARRRIQTIHQVCARWSRLPMALRYPRPAEILGDAALQDMPYAWETSGVEDADLLVDEACMSLCVTPRELWEWLRKRTRRRQLRFEMGLWDIRNKAKWAREESSSSNDSETSDEEEKQRKQELAEGAEEDRLAAEAALTEAEKELIALEEIEKKLEAAEVAAQDARVRRQAGSSRRHGIATYYGYIGDDDDVGLSVPGPQCIGASGTSRKGGRIGTPFDILVLGSLDAVPIVSHAPGMIILLYCKIANGDPWGPTVMGS